MRLAERCAVPSGVALHSSYSSKRDVHVSVTSTRQRTLHFTTRLKDVKTCGKTNVAIVVNHDVHMDIVVGSNEHTYCHSDNDVASQTLAKARVD